MGGGGWDSHEDFRSGCRVEVCVGWGGNRDKEGSDGDDDDEGTPGLKLQANQRCRVWL